MDFNLFHRFATSELTHSGIWAWILQSLDDAAPANVHELRPAARALLARIGVARFDSPIVVRRERKLPRDAGRVDIEAIDRDGRVVVIETKVQARPDLAQRQRYEDAYRAEHDLAGVAIVSTTHDEPWNEIGLRHVGAGDLLTILRAGEYESDLVRQYVAWLDHVLAVRRAEFERAMGDDPMASSQALEGGAAQWSFMCLLGDRIGGRTAARLSAGNSRGGSAWTQLEFSPGGAPSFDRLFYRLESWPGKAAEFTLRQYQKPSDAEKPVRLQKLRAMFRDAAAGSPLAFDTGPKRARTDVMEAKVAQVTIRAVPVAAVLAHLPDVHEKFVIALREMGWPLGPGGPAGLIDPPIAESATGPVRDS